MLSSYSTVFGYLCIYFAWLLVCLFFWIVSNLYFLYLSVCLLVYLSVCIQKTSKRLNRSGPNCVWDLTWLQGRFMDAQNYKNYVRKFLIFVKFWKCAKNIFNSRSFFVVFLYCTKRRCTQRPKSLINVKTAELIEPKCSWTLITLIYLKISS